MKESDECRAYNKRRHHATPPASVCSPLCLTVLGHYSESISHPNKEQSANDTARFQPWVERPS